MQLRARLQEVAALAGAPLNAPSEFERLLLQARVLVKSLTPSGAGWDELDYLLARLTLGNLKDAGIELRRILQAVDAEIVRIDSQVRPLSAEIDTAIEEIDRDRARLLEFEERC